MPLLSLSHVSKAFDATPLFEDVTVDIEPGRKIGLVGRNGTGKSTLLKIMAQRLEVDDGQVFRQRELRLGFQEQELETPPGRTVIDEMRQVFAEELDREARMRQLEERMAEVGDEAEQERLLGEYQRLSDAAQSFGPLTAEQRIERTLTGLGLPTSAWDHELSTFSGGERNLISLARVLLGAPDLLLLDEPSNHLDMDGLEWFIRFMRSTPAAVVMVSHNRHLLDTVVDEIWELSSRKVRVWTGSYGDFERRKAEEQVLQERQYRNQQRLIRRLEFQARRLRDMARAYDDPGQAKRARSMLKRIEQMDLVEAPEKEEGVFKANLKGAPRHGALALEVKDFSFAFGERVLFDQADLEISFGDRVCIVGANGSGKSTFIKALLEEGSWENPKIRIGKAVKLGNYDQFRDELGDARMTLIEWLMGVTTMDYQPATELLHRFRFTRDDLDRPVGSLSGGERSRLQLARLVQEKANFLILDEPTNHLDIRSCEVLEEMLEDFEGTLLVISHDRYFLDRLVNTVVEIDGAKLRRHRGSFAEWWEERSKRRTEGPGGALRLHSQAAAASDAAPREDHSRRKEERKAKQREERRLKREVERLESRILELESEIGELEARLEGAFAPGADHAVGREISASLESKRGELEVAMADWEEAAAKLD